MPYVPTTRKPTGIPAAPMIAVSGAPKSGKSRNSYAICNSPRIDKTYVIDLGEGSADEYGGIGPYEILDWGTSWSDLTDTIKWCVAQPVEEGKLNAVIIDSGSEVWDGLKIRATRRARNSKKNRAALAEDPDFEVDVSMPFWNDAKDAWARIMSPLKLAPHVVGVVLVRSEIVNEVVNGAPTNRKVTSYQAEKTLLGMVTAHVDVKPDHSAWLVDVRSLIVSVDRGGIRLDSDNPLHDVIERLSPTFVFQAPVATVPIDDQRDNPDVITPEQQTELRDALNTVTDVEVRTGLKEAFISQFARPDQMVNGMFDEAKAWIAQRVARLNGDVSPPPPAAEPSDPPETATEPPAAPTEPADPDQVSDAIAEMVDKIGAVADPPAEPAVEEAPAVEEPAPDVDIASLFVP